MAVKLNPINLSISMHASFCMFKENLGILSYSDFEIMEVVEETCKGLYKQRELNAQIQDGPKYWSKKPYQKYSGTLFPTPNGFDLYETTLEKPEEFESR
ncbi:hypothetical protein GcM1_186029 [Golovinomyces cichoracearum]|uniref:Uncharacterized protein n=1 Tax=Golovinomyces cichoracearum TaxID=62708 RepID=A0A420J2V9_9PEZI|nr:hypothetical protein GcM1_186029 [Golovinomyces cichoracearum]